MHCYFTLFDAESLMDYVGLSDRTEHEGYLSELIRLDFSQDDQARKAIQKWLLPKFEMGCGSTSCGRQRVRDAFRVALSRWGFVPLGASLPGIDEDRPPYRPVQVTYALTRKFYGLVWDELFHEPFERIEDTESLLERIDMEFINSPNHPERWGDPKFRSLSQWDEMLGTDAWREGWPP